MSQVAYLGFILVYSCYLVCCLSRCLHHEMTRSISTSPWLLVHLRITPTDTAIKFASTHWYTWAERGTVRVKCLARKHNKMSPARAQNWTAQSGVDCTDHEATTPPQKPYILLTKALWIKKHETSGKKKRDIYLLLFIFLHWAIIHGF